MNKLFQSSRRMLSCNWGTDSIYPPFPQTISAPAYQEFDAKLPPEEYRHFGFGHEWNVLPYAMQNDYDRAREMRDFDTIVLENNRIRAEFLAGFGTRLWSLYDKKLDRELLNVNPVFQLGNLALRNAWFAGGIEWNCGWPGHFPYTASPMHIVTVKDAPYPVLRCFEWERKRGIHWQIDFFLPDDDAAFLCSNVKICNPQPSERPVYWWTNIAVDETDQSRVIVPADQAITNHSNVEDLPFINNEKESFDFTYPANSPSAKDYFFVMKDTPRRWEAILHGDGTGLVYTSGKEMSGRKLFVWGQSQGGLHWQEFLAEPGAAHYCEIQSGLAQTQMGCVPLDSKSQIQWTEAFGAMSLNPDIVQGEWKTAQKTAAENLENILPEKQFEQWDITARKVADLPVNEFLQMGSGWGALEIIRQDGVPFHQNNAVCYPRESLGPLQQPWLDLLQGKTPDEDAMALPSFMIQREWEKILCKAPSSPWVNYQLAICAASNQQFALAHAFLDQAKPEKPRNIALVYHAKAMIYVLQKNDEKAVEYWCKALPLIPDPEENWEVLKAAWPCFKRAEAAAEFRKFLPADAETHARGRIRILAISAALECDDLETAARIFATPFSVADMMEGELSTSDIYLTWKTKELALQEGVKWTLEYYRDNYKKFDIPWWLDFRMGVYIPR